VGLLASASQCTMREQISENPSSAAAASARRSAPVARSERKEDRSAERMEFGVNRVDAARLAGVDIQNVQRATDLKPNQLTLLQNAVNKGTIPLRLSLRVYGRNPTPGVLKLSMLAYEVRIDDLPVATGTTGANTVLEPRSIVTLPLDITANVLPALRGTSAAAYAAGLADMSGARPRVTVRVLPTFVNQAGRMYQPEEFVAVPVVTPNSRRN
jgi:hypothetical protein